MLKICSQKRPVLIQKVHTCQYAKRGLELKKAYSNTKREANTQNQYLANRKISKHLHSNTHGLRSVVVRSDAWAYADPRARAGGDISGRRLPEPRLRRLPRPAAPRSAIAAHRRHYRCEVVRSTSLQGEQQARRCRHDRVPAAPHVDQFSDKSNRVGRPCQEGHRRRKRRTPELREGIDCASE
jgi:hypothetical protein